MYSITCLLSAGEVSTITNINYEALSSTSFILTVTVSDPVTSDTQDLTVDIIDENETPVFSPTSYTISTTEGTVWLGFIYCIICFG